MSSFIEDFNYNRNNITGSDGSVVSSATFNPQYGAQINFSAENSTWKGSNYSQFVSPVGLNNLMLTTQLSFIEGLDRTKTLLQYLQSVTTGQMTGEQAFTGNVNYVNFGQENNPLLYFNDFENIESAGFSVDNGTINNHQFTVREVAGGNDSIVTLGSAENKFLKLNDTFSYFAIEFSGFKESGEYIVSGSYQTDGTSTTPKLRTRTLTNGDGVSPRDIITDKYFNAVQGNNTNFVFTGTINDSNSVLEIGMSDAGATDTSVLIDSITIRKRNATIINLDGSEIYNNFSGSQVSDFTVTDIGKDTYKIDVSLFNNTVSSVLNNGEGFIRPVLSLYNINTPIELLRTNGYSFLQSDLNSHGVNLQMGNGNYKKFDVIQKTGDSDFKWVCFSGATSVKVALPFPNTEIYEETWTQVTGSAQGTKIVSASSKPQNTTIDVTAGKFYRATKYANFTKSDRNHIMAPFSFAGASFKATTSRTTPHRAYILNLDSETQTISRMIGADGVNSTAVQSITLGAGQTGQLPFTENDSHFFTGTTATDGFPKNFLMSITSEGTSSTTDDTDKMLLTPVTIYNKEANNLQTPTAFPYLTNTYTYRRRNNGQDAAIINSLATFESDFSVYHASGVSSTEIGDGAGGDGTQSLGIHNLYNYASYGNKLQDYAIVTPYSGSITVSYYTGDSWRSMHTHSLTGGVGLTAAELTRTNFPQGVKAHLVYSRMENGGAVFYSSSSQAGRPSVAGNEPFLPFNDSQLWKFESTCPVAIFINDTSADEEVLVGYNGIIGNTNSQNKTHDLHNYYYVSGDTKSIGPELQGEAGFTGGIGATRTFFWEPDRSVPVIFDHSSRINKFKGSFHKQLNVAHNQNRIERIELTFSNRTDKEAYSLLHFLESHLGHKHFVYRHNINALNKNKVYYCPSWSHTFNYKNSNTIKTTFVEIVTPLIPQL